MEQFEIDMITNQILDLTSQRDFILNNTSDYISYKIVYLETTIAEYKEPYDIASEGNITMREHLINVLNSIRNNEQQYIDNEINKINSLILRLEESLIVPEVIEDVN